MSFPKTRRFLVPVLLLVAGILIGRTCGAPAPETTDGAALAEAQPEVWSCAMHPQVRLPEPGACPICGMDLTLAATGDDEDEGPRVLRMSATAMALADIETAPVERRYVAHEVSMVGKVALDETRVSYITSWVPGRLDRLFVDYTGVTVRAGDHLVEIYSPTLYSAQQELLQAIATAKTLEKSSLEVLRASSGGTVVSAREKLRLYGLTPEQIQGIVDRGSPDEHMTIYAPGGGVVVHKTALEGMYVGEGTRLFTIADLSKVWVLLDAYESDLAWLRYGQDVEFHVEAYPGEVFHGRVAFIDPLLDDRTRTVKVRLNVENEKGRLKPEMFVSATAQAVLTPHGKIVDENLAGEFICPMHPEVLAATPEACPECGMTLVAAAELGFVAQSPEGPSLVIPSTAPLLTGKRAVVYVRLPDRDRPTFEGRVIELGPRAGDWYVVIAGLAEGEQVVVQGNFKLDSELQIRARPSMMNPAGGGPTPGHDHGGAKSAGDAAPEALEPVVAPEEFRRQLGAVLDAYLELQAALAGDADAPDAAQTVVQQLDGVDMTLLTDAAHRSWMKVQPELAAAAAALAAAGELEERRARLAPLTERLVPVLVAFGFERAGADVGVFHCPMAADGEGADWLQTGDETRNPYYGSMMLACGSRTRVIAGKE